MKPLSGILILLGITLLAAAFIYPRAVDPASLWSERQAKERTQAGRLVHQLHHEHSHDPAQSERIEKRREVAMSQYEQIQAQLDAARQRPQRIASVLKWAGVACIFLGVVVYYTIRRT